MIRTGLARTTPSYDGLTPPFAPGAAYPEIRSLWGDALVTGPPNPAFAGVRAGNHAHQRKSAHFEFTRFTRQMVVRCSIGSDTGRPFRD